jgi:hypothetical protein
LLIPLPLFIDNRPLQENVIVDEDRISGIHHALLIDFGVSAVGGDSGVILHPVLTLDENEDKSDEGSDDGRWPSGLLHRLMGITDANASRDVWAFGLICRWVCVPCS